MPSPSSSSSLVVDIHTHIYPPSYLSLLRSRKTTPYIYDPPPSTSSTTSDASEAPSPRLIILPSDDDSSRPPHLRGRPIDSSYSSFRSKRTFMSRHGITISVVSLANPWLDFLREDPKEAADWATRVNNDLDQSCTAFNAESLNEKNDDDNNNEKARKLYGFGTLPLGAPPHQITSEITRLKTLPTIKGIVMGTTGLGSGLDDPAMRPIWQTLQDTQTLVFLHPHYGLPDTAFGGPEVVAKSGHVLPLALGFPLETTIAVSRMFLAGVFDEFPGLRMLLAHSGGTLPFLAGRIQSCVEHEREFVANGGFRQGPRRTIWEVLNSNVYLDAVIYGEVGLKAAIHAGGSTERVMFGTDHPFFPALDQSREQWPSVTTNYTAINKACGQDTEAANSILGGNAVRILGLDT
ncbi:MAG: hypothetical protein Q9227_008797 [Pyrenula ochraceoflavens]